jgi:hypothetical protein
MKLKKCRTFQTHEIRSINLERLGPKFALCRDKSIRQRTSGNNCAFTNVHSLTWGITKTCAPFAHCWLVQDMESEGERRNIWFSNELSQIAKDSAVYDDKSARDMQFACQV